jgi:hypothetical protein
MHRGFFRAVFPSDPKQARLLQSGQLCRLEACTTTLWYKSSYLPPSSLQYENMRL